MSVMPELKPTISFDDFLKLDLRIATIVEAEAHPNADRLLKLQLDVGELGRRQICAGVRQHYEPSSLVGKRIVIVANLEPRTIRGEQSEGMLLAASVLDEAGQTSDVALLTPMREAPAGSTVG